MKGQINRYFILALMLCVSICCTNQSWAIGSNQEEKQDGQVDKNQSFVIQDFTNSGIQNDQLSVHFMVAPEEEIGRASCRERVLR